MEKSTCSVDDCVSPGTTRGLCSKHYSRLRRHGDVNFEKGYGPAKTDPMVRFWAKVNKDGPLIESRPDLGPCWLWTAATTYGYGAFGEGGRHDRRGWGAHRFAYVRLVGAVPDGLSLDHLCHTYAVGCVGGNRCLHRRCVNPDHLEPVTQLENVVRGQSIANDWAGRTHCDYGHEFMPENTYQLPASSGSGRRCRICQRRRNNESLQRARDRKRQEA